MKFLLSVALVFVVSTELVAAQSPDSSPTDEPVLPRQNPGEPATPMPQETAGSQAAPDLLPESGTVPSNPPSPATSSEINSAQAISAALQKSADVEKSAPPSSKAEALLRKARNAKTARGRREYLKAYRAAVHAEGIMARRHENRSARLRHSSHVYLQSRRHSHHGHHTYLEASRRHKHTHRSHRPAVVYEYIDYGPE